MPPDSVTNVLEDLLRDDALAPNFLHHEVLPGRSGHHRPLPEDLPAELARGLGRLGISSVYSHQEECHQLARRGESLVVVTPTASGKSLCYQLPLLATALSQPGARSLLIFPTKALGQDQVSAMQTLIDACESTLRTHTYDGDTSPQARHAIRQSGDLVVTNPDMLHAAILPHHTRWVRMFQNLRFIVLDELHSYRGVFGSHLANVIRRLDRVCRFYGSSPTYICCSATIANPEELARTITGRDCRLVDQNGAPAGERHLLFYQPPVVNRQLGLRRSALGEARRLTRRTVQAGLQTVCFARSRLEVEVLLRHLQGDLAGALGPARQVRGYRGGYLPLERREIERGLRDGTIRGVVSTNALELGVDVGTMDASILCGFPGTLAATWQQMGRAGRRGGTSLSVLVASSNPVDQYLVNNPQHLLDGRLESGLADPENLLVLAAHLQAGAFELPFEESERFGQMPRQPLLHVLQEDGLLRHHGSRWHWSGEAFPAEGISLRSVPADNVVIVDTSGNGTRIIGEVDQFSAPLTVHPQAIYLHGGRQYHVDRLDWGEKRAYVHPVEVEHYTDAELAVQVEVLERFAGPSAGAIAASHGEVRVSALAAMFKKIRLSTNENIGSGPIDLPQQDLHTTAYWLQLENEALEGMSRADVESTLQGLGRALRVIAALHVMCDPRDLGVAPQVRSPHTGQPTVIVYERFPGGVGLSSRLFGLHAELLRSTARLVEACACAEGCPSCVGPPAESGVGARSGVISLLERADRVTRVTA